MLSKFLIKYIFKQEKDFAVFLGTKHQKGSLFVAVETKFLWKKESLPKKLKSILYCKWKPRNISIQETAKDIFMTDIFGGENDCGEALFELNSWHNSQDWDLSALTEDDVIKADALEAMTVLTRLRYRTTSSFLSLNLFSNAPFICILIQPMIIKLPVISFQYFLHIHSTFSFNSIRKAKHPLASEIISYLYDVLYIQQKIGIALHRYLHSIDYANKHKKDALFINAEINAIMDADLVFTYLKASIEKIIVVIGLTHGIINLDSKKNHKSKIDALTRGLPKKVLDLYYWNFVREFISSENLEELNNYRSGLLHKRGISELQPHHYVGEKAKDIPLQKIFQILHEQHSKNTAVLLGTLAILTDKLVELDPPSISISDIPMTFDLEKFTTLMNDLEFTDSKEG